MFFVSSGLLFAESVQWGFTLWVVFLFSLNSAKHVVTNKSLFFSCFYVLYTCDVRQHFCVTLLHTVNTFVLHCYIHLNHTWRHISNRLIYCSWYCLQFSFNDTTALWVWMQEQIFHHSFFLSIKISKTPWMSFQSVILYHIIVAPSRLDGIVRVNSLAWW